MSAQNHLMAKYFTESKILSPSKIPGKSGLSLELHALEDLTMAMPLPAV